KPVYVVGAERCKWKFGEFHKSLRERGLVRPFTGLEDMSESWSYPPLNDTAEAANRVHEALAERGLHKTSDNYEDESDVVLEERVLDYWD
ncbi:mitochondrial fission protein ELM1, partial [Tanacetum coccineum]